MCVLNNDAVGAHNCMKVDLGPVVQSIVSLTSSIRSQLVKCFTTLYNTNKFYDFIIKYTDIFVEKMRHFFKQKSFSKF